MRPSILTLESFPTISVSKTTFTMLHARGYSGTIVGSTPWKRGTPIPAPQPEAALAQSNLPYIVVVKEKYDIDYGIGGDGKVSDEKKARKRNKPTGRCSIILVGKGVYHRDFRDRVNNVTVWNRIERSNIRIIRRGLRLNFQIRSDELPTLPGLDVRHILTRQLSKPAP